MKKLEFELEGYEFIELNKLLKFMGLVDTGGEANSVIENREVEVNNSIETQKRKKLRPGDKVVFNTIEITIR